MVIQLGYMVQDNANLHLSIQIFALQHDIACQKF